MDACMWFYLYTLFSREISLASASNMRGHFGCIFKATANCATGVWCVFMCVYWELNDGTRVTLVVGKNLGRDPRGNRHGHVRAAGWFLGCV